MGKMQSLHAFTLCCSMFDVCSVCKHTHSLHNKTPFANAGHARRLSPVPTGRDDIYFAPWQRWNAMLLLGDGEAEMMIPRNSVLVIFFPVCLLLNGDYVARRPQIRQQKEVMINYAVNLECSVVFTSTPLSPNLICLFCVCFLCVCAQHK